MSSLRRKSSRLEKSLFSACKSPSAISVIRKRLKSSPTILCYMPISSRLMVFEYLNTVQQFFPLAPTLLLQPNLKNLFVFSLLKFTNVAT
uniref:Uncharacterized protein n=1 Tax=Caenorhabditis japonica TaxID=281687 RepID=A0A8R1IUJ6_CAEJA